MRRPHPEVAAHGIRVPGASYFGKFPVFPVTISEHSPAKPLQRITASSHRQSICSLSYERMYLLRSTTITQ
jgi:hypothetical protein